MIADSESISSLKLVYCLTSSGGDLYEAMTRVSLATVRLTNPSARIEIACDEQSYQALQASDSQLFREADAVHSFATPQGPPTFRNRFVKTQLRLLLSGPFLFLDSDTVVRKPLSALQHVHGDLAAVPNHSADSLSEQIWCEDQANLDAMGWRIREPYVNGGVIWCQDTPGAHRFAQAWHRNWLANVEQTGRYRDQPALNYSIVETNAQMTVLDHCWNAQVEIAPKQAKNATIWHMYLESHPETIFEFERLLKRGLVTSSSLKPVQTAQILLSKPHPWCSRSVVDDLLALRILRINRITPTTKLWLSSTPLYFISQNARASVHRLRLALKLL
jgi:hypothetical protein